MSTEKTISPEEQEAIDFIKHEDNKEEGVVSLLIKFSNTQNEELLQEIENLKDEVRNAEDERRDAESDKSIAEEEAEELEDRIAELEELEPNTLEEDLKLTILKRIYKNLNLEQVELLEDIAKVYVAQVGATYQDYD